MASRLAAGRVSGVRLVVVAGRPVTGAARLPPASVGVQTLAREVRR